MNSASARTNYTPKPGDTVKATLGDSVLYGKIVNVYGDVEHALLVENNTAAYEFMLTSEWTIEPWTPPVTFKPLTVVRLADDAPSAVSFSSALISEDGINKTPEFVRHSADTWTQYGLESYEFYDADIALLLAAGKAEVLFEGVDE